MTPINIFFTIACYCAFGYLGGWLAARKGYWPRAGVYLGVLFGPFALAFGVFLPMTKAGREQAELERQITQPPRRANCPGCGREIPYGSKVCPFCSYQI